MDEHPNAKIVRDWDNDESLTPADMVTDDVVWHVIGRSEPYLGKAAMVASLGSGVGNADWEWVGQTTHDVLANDEHVVCLVETTMRRGDRTLTYRTAEIYHMRGGLVSERWAFSDDTAAINEFFG